MFIDAGEEVRHSQSFVQKLLFLLQFVFQTLHFNLQLDVLEKKFVKENKKKSLLIVSVGYSVKTYTDFKAVGF